MVASQVIEAAPLLSFQVGDLVLTILDEHHDNYMLFTVSPTLYFMHAESLPTLDLRPGEDGKCHTETQTQCPLSDCVRVTQARESSASTCFLVCLFGLHYPDYFTGFC